MSLFFEFHDARVASVLLEPGRTVISFSHLYIFDEAKGRFQPAALELGPGNICGSFPAEEENDLGTGTLRVGETEFINVVSLPLETELPVHLTMSFLWGGEFTIEASGAVLRLNELDEWRFETLV